MDGRPGALDGISVLELTSGVAGAYAGKLLADLGADVTMVETAGGSPLRRRGPRAEGHADGAFFEFLAGGKRSVVVGGETDAELAHVLRELAWAADIALVDGTSPYQRLLPGFGEPSTASNGPGPEHLVVVDLSPYGRSGPYAGWRSSELTTWAMGGYLSFTGAPDREPLWLSGGQAGLHAGTHAAFAALAALHERRRSGWGQTIEVSETEAVLTAHAWLVSSWAACGQVLSRQPGDLIRAADGWVYVMRIVPNDNLFVLIERFDLLEENLTADLATWYANIPRIFEAVAQWAVDHPVDDIVRRGQELRLAVTPVLDAAGVRADPQLAARNWWEHDPSTNGFAFPGQPYHLSASPSRRRGPAPALHAQPRQAAAGALPAEQPPQTRPDRPANLAPGEPPLQGLKVVEVTNNWAGPVCGRFLADLGADVMKVEWAAKPATRALFWAGPFRDLQRQGLHRAMYFNEINRNKGAFVADLSLPGGRELFLRLIRDVDVVIENNSARVMPNLGLGWDVLSEANPRLVMLSMSGYGASGPRRDWVAYGSNIETTSGLTSVTGYPDGQLSRTTLFYADPVSGIHGAVAVLAALEHRRRTGEGQWVEMSLNECGAVFCAEALVAREVTGVAPGPAGNRRPDVAPQGVYRCAGTDNWVAITVGSDGEWPPLARLIGRPALAADPGLATLAGRAARHDELDAAISAWTATLEHYEVAWELQRQGIAAAPVLANWQMLADPHLHRRGFYQPIEHPVVGVYPTTTWPWRFSRTPARLQRPAPLFAEGNRLMWERLGLTEGEVAALYESGVTADQPR